MTACLTTKEKEDLIKEDSKSAEIIKPYVSGRNVRRWKVENSNEWLIFTRRGIDIEKYPAIKRHLLKFKQRLVPTGEKDSKTGKSLSRKIGTYEWYEIQDNIAYWKEFEKPKIIYQEINRTDSYAFDEEGFYPNKTTFIIPNGSLYLLALMNSKVATFFYHTYTGVPIGGFFNTSKPIMEKLPIPDAEDWQKEIIEKFVDYILFLTKTDGEKLIVNYFESIINALVYELFLTDELHSADKEFFSVLQKENPPVLAEHAGREDEEIRRLFEKLSHVNHPVRHNLYFLSNLESVRIIEGK